MSLYSAGTATVGSSTLLSSVNGVAGTGNPSSSVPDTLSVQLGSGLTTTVTYNGTTVNTVGDLINQLNDITGVSASLNSAGKLTVSASSGQSMTLGGNLASKLGLISNGLGTGQTFAAASAAPAASYVAEFDAARSQYDGLINNSSYQGINLISGTTNAPLSVVFNEAATNPNKLTISAVDLTSTGLGLSSAAGHWTSVSDVQSSLAALTNATNTLNSTASSLGQNLAVVQTRQDFTNKMIQTLQAGSDNLTNADMNEESANMLALQTRQQLGIQALSLSSQANSAVMRLFG